MTREARMKAELLKAHSGVTLSRYNTIQKKASQMSVEQLVETITDLSQKVSSRGKGWRSKQKDLLCYQTVADQVGVSYTEDDQKQAAARSKQRYIDEQIALMGSYKQKRKNALDRGISFELTFAEYCRIMSRKTCAYTGVAFNDEFPSSLDRIHPSIGYTKDNTLKVLLQANNAKNLLLEQGKHMDKQTVRMNLQMLTKMVAKLNELGFESPERN